MPTVARRGGGGGRDGPELVPLAYEGEAAVERGYEVVQLADTYLHSLAALVVVQVPLLLEPGQGEHFAYKVLHNTENMQSFFII